MKFRVVILTAVACLTFQLLTVQAAPVITLVDGSSFAQIDVGSQAGMFNWLVNGQDQLNQQWFWYRVGQVGPELSIDTISAPVWVQPNAKTLYTTYQNGSFSVRVEYSLNGSSPPSGIADLAELITIHNFTATPLDFHFFQYSDFDLLNTIGGEVVQLGTNLQGKYNEAYQADGTLALSETVAAPGANRGEVAFIGATLAKLNDGVADNLNNNTGPVGPGDVTWALQWDVVIGPGQDYLISKDKYLQVIPEPTTVTLVGLGLIGLLALRRRK